MEFKPFHIWNVDESGVGDVPSEQQVIGLTGVPASQTVAGEKPQNTTVVTYASAGGLCMPPMIVFRQVRWTAIGRKLLHQVMPSGVQKLAT